MKRVRPVTHQYVTCAGDWMPSTMMLNLSYGARCRLLPQMLFRGRRKKRLLDAQDENTKLQHLLSPSQQSRSSSGLVFWPEYPGVRLSLKGMRTYVCDAKYCATVTWDTS